MATENYIEKVDYLFVGSGASCTLLLMSMESEGLLSDKKVMIIDPDRKLKNDKTNFVFNLVKIKVKV